MRNCMRCGVEMVEDLTVSGEVDPAGLRVSRGGVDYQAPLLVDHYQVLVLVYHVQGDVLGLQGQLLRGGEKYVIALPGGAAVVLFQGLAL